MEDLRRPSMGPSPEERIANIFSYAASHNRFLIVNDIEHLLANPEAPGNGLHKSLAHAFRKAAEAHTMPFAATTEQEDLAGVLAALFSDHLSCGPLSAYQVKAAYRHFAGRPAPKLLRGRLYVGDFARAASFMRYTEQTVVDDQTMLRRLTKNSMTA